MTSCVETKPRLPRFLTLDVDAERAVEQGGHVAGDGLVVGRADAPDCGAAEHPDGEGVLAGRVADGPPRPGYVNGRVRSPVRSALPDGVRLIHGSVTLPHLFEQLARVVVDVVVGREAGPKVVIGEQEVRLRAEVPVVHGRGDPTEHVRADDHDDAQADERQRGLELLPHGPQRTPLYRTVMTPVMPSVSCGMHTSSYVPGLSNV